ncbi:Ubiquinol oxidase 1, mitochondrial [Apostasia shenzhenica]|uniref:Ubiquinol oxidase 1, mitochondrial n=1 Tax=Apostasia shenzhenica TaxID=1088818 RepID=A0A2I0A9E9_9ASPA|nr:Ubiquinol oxidase 1, mitochondrial [Apostasia shenzhenica]
MSSTTATAQSVRLLSQHIFFAAASTRPAVSSGASPAILYGLKAAPRSWPTPTFGVRCMGTAAAAPGNADVASADAAHFASGPKKEKGVASYWGVDPPKVTRDDGSDWKWSCFKPGDTYSSDLSINLAKQHAPVTWMDKLARWTVKSLRWPTDVFFQVIKINMRITHAHLNFHTLNINYACTAEEVRMPSDDAGDGGGGAGDGRRVAASSPFSPAVRAQRGLDPSAAGGGGEREDAPHDVHGGVAAAVVRESPRRGGSRGFLQRLLLGLPPLSQVRSPGCRLSRRGSHPLLHRVPQGDRRRQHRQCACSGHRHRLLAPPPQLHAPRCRHRRPRRRGTPPRRQPLCLGYSRSRA